MLLVAVKADSVGEVLDSPPYIEDPLEENPITLPPRGKLEGEIDLQYRFPALREVLKEHDVLIFWSYRLRALDLGPSARMGGWVEVPRAR